MNIMKGRFKKIQFISGVLALLFILIIGNSAFAVDEANDVPVLEIAPGEFLPIAVKLTNFGDKKEVQVLVNYEIQDAGDKVFFRLSEMVPVEATASFVKNIRLPITLPSGQYFAFSKINYPDQAAPAVSKFEFAVKRKFLGLFIDQLAIYSLVIIFIGGSFFVLSRIFIGRRTRRLALLDYAEVPKESRLFFELISDIIASSRKQNGDRALELAAEIDGLVLDEEDGRVLNVNKAPAEIIALLILKYEKAFKKKIKYQPRRSSREMKKQLKFLEENLAIARKYFE